jgi:hypothetical protein
MRIIFGDTDKKRIIYSIIEVTLIFTLFFGVFTNRVLAQSTNSWPDPINISQSGSASDPAMTVDPDGLIHVVWKDEILGNVYAFGEGTEWSMPSPVVLPSGEEIPFLVADSNGFIHLLWKDLDNRLFYSRSTSSTFLDSAIWSPYELISQSVLDIKLALDDNGDLHLVYVNPGETVSSQAGVYYQRLNNGTGSWSIPKLLYHSSYFRSLDLSNSNVDITTTGKDEFTTIFVVWDNRPRERVFLTKSSDNGTTWSNPEEIDQPRPGVVSSGPSNIIVHAEGEEAMLLWQVGEQGSNCNHYFQWSQDGGESWSLKQPILSNMPICFGDMQIVSGAEYPILMGEADQVYLLAWDGAVWSVPQIQTPLTSFIDEDTQNAVQLGCRQLIQNESNTLYVIGCDQASGSDIWVMHRLLFDLTASFQIESGWSTLDDVETFGVKIGSPNIIADKFERAHLFWSQSENDDLDALGRSIYYSFRQNGQWSPSSEIFSSPFGKAEQIDSNIDSEGNLNVVWSGGFGGEIYFGQADASQAFEASAWGEPIALPSPLPVGSAPEIFIDHNQIVYVTYAIPLNEKRGIYITKSDDSALSWKDSITVFDAQSAGWDMVDNPHLAITQDGHLHLTWTRFSLPSGEGPLELYYSKSEDEGLTWTEPDLMEDNPVYWSGIISPAQDVVHLLWQQDSSSGSTFFHEQSLDSGTNWDRIAPVSIFGEIVSNPSLSSDSAGRLHLILLVRGGLDAYFLQHWIYDEQSWTAGANNYLQFPPGTEVSSIESDSSGGKNLNVVLINRNLSMDGSQGYHLFFTTQILENPSNSANKNIQITPTQKSISTPIPTIQATGPIPTDIGDSEIPFDFPLEQGDQGNPEWMVIAVPIAIGFFALVLIVFIINWIRR